MENLPTWVFVVPAIMLILLLACIVGLAHFNRESKKLRAMLAESRGVPAMFSDLHDKFIYEILADVVTVDAKSYLLCRDCGTFAVRWVQMDPPAWLADDKFFQVNHRMKRLDRVEPDLYD